jgi:hypothetical protein
MESNHGLDQAVITELTRLEGTGLVTSSGFSWEDRYPFPIKEFITEVMRHVHSRVSRTYGKGLARAIMTSEKHELTWEQIF